MQKHARESNVLTEARTQCAYSVTCGLSFIKFFIIKNVARCKLLKLKITASCFITNIGINNTTEKSKINNKGFCCSFLAVTHNVCMHLLSSS